MNMTLNDDVLDGLLVRAQAAVREASTLNGVSRTPSEVARGRGDRVVSMQDYRTEAEALDALAQA
jgi:hypothetical protein